MEGSEKPGSGNTPEAHKELALTLARYLKQDWDPAIKKVATKLADHETFCDQQFSSISGLFDTHKKEIEANRGYMNQLKAQVDHFSHEATETIAKHDADIQALEERMNKHEVLTKSIVSEQVKIQIAEEFSTRLSDMEALRKKFNKLKFSEQPATDEELGDFKVNFKKSINGVGLCPITRTDLQEIMKNSKCGVEDAFRIAVSDYLRFEMNYSTAFIKNMERFLVSYIWDKKNTLYIVVTDLAASGLKRVKQESWVLWKHQVEGVQTRELRRLEVPQYRERYRAMEDYCDQLRFAWKAENPAAHASGRRRRTRILETDEYDYIIQVKEHDEKVYKPHAVPEEIMKHWPKINFKCRNYIQYDLQSYKPSQQDKTGDRDKVPTRRKRNENPILSPPASSADDLTTSDLQIHHVKPKFEFVPGFVQMNPISVNLTSTMSMSLDMASHLSGKTPPAQVPELNGGVEIDQPDNFLAEDAPDNVKAYAEKMKKREEKLREIIEKKEKEKQTIEEEKRALLEEKIAAEHKRRLIEENEAKLRKLLSEKANSDNETLPPIINKDVFQDPNDTFSLDRMSQAGTMPPPGATGAAAGGQPAKPFKSFKPTLMPSSFEHAKRIWKETYGTDYGQQLMDTGEEIGLDWIRLEDQRHKEQPPLINLDSPVINPNLRRPNLDDNKAPPAGPQPAAGDGAPPAGTEERQPAGADKHVGAVDDQAGVDQPPPVGGNVVTVAGRVRVDERPVANVEDVDANGNPSTFSPPPVFGPVNKPTGTISKVKKTPKKASKEQKIAQPLVPNSEADVTQPLNSQEMNDSDVNFETASEGDEEITIIENVANDDTILSPAIGLNPGDKFLFDVSDKNQTLMESFLYKPQSTLDSQMCEHSKIDETQDGTFQLPPAQKPPASPPLNTSKPGQQAYPSPGISPQLKTPGSGKKSLKKILYPQRSAKSWNLKKRVEQARLKAGTATKVGRHQLPNDPNEQVALAPKPVKRQKPESGFIGQQANKDPRTVSPDDKKQVEIVREFTEPQDHVRYQPPSPAPDTSGSLIEIQSSTPQTVHRLNLLNELKGVVHAVRDEYHGQETETESAEPVQETESKEQEPGSKKQDLAPEETEQGVKKADV